MSQKDAGFTLIELMITIAIFAVLAAIATPNAISWIRNSQFNSAVREVKSAVQNVRMHAMKSNSQADITINAGTNSFQITKRERGAGTTRNQVVNLEGEITLNSTNNPLQFNSRGMAATNGTITIQNNAGLCRQIVIARPGSSRITMCP